MSFYFKYLKLTETETEAEAEAEAEVECRKNPQRFFTPYRNIKNFALDLAVPIVAPIFLSGIAILDALYAAFYLAKGLVQAVTLDHEKAVSTFKQFGDHFSGFILTATLAIIIPFTQFALLCTRSVASCIPSNENVPSSSLTR